MLLLPFPDQLPSALPAPCRPPACPKIYRKVQIPEGILYGSFKSYTYRHIISEQVAEALGGIKRDWTQGEEERMPRIKIDPTQGGGKVLYDACKSLVRGSVVSWITGRYKRAMAVLAAAHGGEAQRKCEYCAESKPTTTQFLAGCRVLPYPYKGMCKGACVRCWLAEKADSCGCRPAVVVDSDSDGVSVSLCSRLCALLIYCATGSKRNAALHVGCTASDFVCDLTDEEVQSLAGEA
ncbi:hypothetical protein JX266_013776 [Neoarthrinium moseri]|nr:hypothetical protein JX266_013776 [Neoarthrinium moseri]